MGLVATPNRDKVRTLGTLCAVTIFARLAAVTLLRRWLLALMLFVVSAGCTPSATPALAIDPLERTKARLEDQKFREQLAEVLATPEMQRVFGEMSAGMAKGVALGLSNEEFAARMVAMSRQMADVMGESLAHRMHRDVAPASAAVASAAIEAAMRSAIRTASEEIPSTLAPAVQKAMTDTIGPAVEATLRDNVGRGFIAIVNSPELRSALAETSRAMAHEMVRGTSEAMAERDDQEQKRSFWVRAISAVSALGWVGWMLIVAVVVATAWMLVRRAKSRSRTKGGERERELREAVLLTLATTMRAAEGRPWADDLRTALRDEMDAGAAPSNWTSAPPSGPAQNGKMRDDRKSHS